MYDGYHFANDMTDVYNPFSLLNAFADRDFRNYWYQSGTPTFLIKLLSQHKINPTSLSEKNIKIKDPTMVDENYTAPIPIFYQTGYLTIKEYSPQTKYYQLGFPNREVESSFLYNLLPIYTNKDALSIDRFLMR